MNQPTPDIRTAIKSIVLASNFTKQANQKVDELVQLFTAAVETVIGKDDDESYDNYGDIHANNNLRDEQRQRLAELVEQKSWEGANSVEIFHDPRFDDGAQSKDEGENL